MHFWSRCYPDPLHENRSCRRRIGPPLCLQEIDQRAEFARNPLAVRIVEGEAGKRRAPVGKQAYEAAVVEETLDIAVNHVDDAESVEGCLHQQSEIVENKAAGDGEIKGLTVAGEFPALDLDRRQLRLRPFPGGRGARRKPSGRWHGARWTAASAFTGLHEGRAFAKVLDVTDHAGVAATVADVEAEIGAIDVLVNNAGYGMEGVVGEILDG